MTKIYEQAKDVHVKSNIIYAKDNTAYKDVTCSIPYTTSELKEAFLKGAVIDIPAGYYNNLERLMLTPSSMSLSKDGLASLNFDVPWYGRNKYRCYISEDSDAATLIGSPKAKKRVDEQPNDGTYNLILTRTDGSGDMFGIEFGPGTEMHSTITRILNKNTDEFGNVDIEMQAVYTGVPKGSDVTLTLTCNGVTVTETIYSNSSKKVSLSVLKRNVGTNTLRIEVNGLQFGDAIIFKAEVYDYGTVKEYEAPKDRICFVSSIPDPT